MLQKISRIDLLLEARQLIKANRDVLSFTHFLALPFTLHWIVMKFLVKFRNINVLSFNALNGLFIFRFVLFDFFQESLVRCNRHFSIVLLHFDKLSLGFY